MSCYLIYVVPTGRFWKYIISQKEWENGWRVTTGSCLFLWDVGFQIFPEKRKYVSRHTEAFKMIDCLLKPWYFGFSLGRKWIFSLKFYRNVFSTDKDSWWYRLLEEINFWFWSLTVGWNKSDRLRKLISSADNTRGRMIDA